MTHEPEDFCTDCPHLWDEHGTGGCAQCRACPNALLNEVTTVLTPLADLICEGVGRSARRELG